MGVCCSGNQGGPTKIQLTDAESLDEKASLELIEECSREHNIEVIIKFIEDDRFGSLLNPYIACSWVQEPTRIAAVAQYHLYEYFSDPILRRDPQNRKIIQATKLMQRSIRNLNSQRRDIVDTALILLSTLVQYDQDDFCLNILRQDYTILFDLLTLARQEKRVTLSQLIRNCFYDNAEAQKIARLHMVKYVQVLPTFANSHNCLKHLKNIEAFYKPKHKFDAKNFELCCECGLKKYLRKLRQDKFEQIPTISKDWKAIMSISRSIQDTGPKKAAVIKEQSLASEVLDEVETQEENKQRTLPRRLSTRHNTIQGSSNLAQKLRRATVYMKSKTLAQVQELAQSPLKRSTTSTRRQTRLWTGMEPLIE